MYAELYVGLGGFIGAVFRFILSAALQVPLGTLSVNILGSFTLSFITYSAEKSMALPESSRLFLAVGMLGTFTTMSTFSLKTFRLVEERQNLLFLANLALNNILCLAGIYMGKLASTLI